MCVFKKACVSHLIKNAQVFLKIKKTTDVSAYTLLIDFREVCIKPSLSKSALTHKEIRAHMNK